LFPNEGWNLAEEVECDEYAKSIIFEDLLFEDRILPNYLLAKTILSFQKLLLK
jgi:hypothetical protein